MATKQIEREDITIFHQYAGEDVISVTTHDTFGIDGLGSFHSWMKFKQVPLSDKLYAIYWNVYGTYDYEGRSDTHDDNGIIFWMRKPTIEDAIAFLVEFINERLANND